MKFSTKKILIVLSALILAVSFTFVAIASEEANEQGYEVPSGDEQEYEAPSGNEQGYEAPIAQVLMTVTGVVNENYQIEGDDGEFYEIEGEGGDELVQLAGNKVKVTGYVIKESGLNFLQEVKSYEIINE
jgi:hypothetical protein